MAPKSLTKSAPQAAAHLSASTTGLPTPLARLVILSIALALSAHGLWYWRSGGFQGQVVDLDDSTGPLLETPIDINRADWPQLCTLPGVRETLARRIVQTREQQGRFRTQSDLTRVPGIGQATAERIAPWLVFSPISPRRTTSPDALASPAELDR